MTTFQAVIYAFTGALAGFLPIGAQAHSTLLSYLLSWTPPQGAFLSAFSVGMAFSLFVYFRHDWASLISSFLQVILFRRRPMTLDERLPLFLMITSLPSFAAAYYFELPIQNLEWNPFHLALSFACASIPLGFFSYLNRSNKGMFSWNGVDALCVGVTQALTLIPGWDRLTTLLIGCYFLNYKKEASLKYAYLALGPYWLSQAVSEWKALHLGQETIFPPLIGFSWLSYGATLSVSFFVGLLILGMCSKANPPQGPARFITYRFFLAVFVGLFWFWKAYDVG